MKKNGLLITNHVYLMPHEQATVDLLIREGFTVELVPRSKIKGVHTADILLNGTPYEIKSPQGDTKWTIPRNLKRAKKQSYRIIIDLRRMRRSDVKCMNDINKYLLKSKTIKQIKIITKSRTILDMQP